MDENEKKEPETAQGSPKPEDYSRYMGTLNRIYRRNNDPAAQEAGRRHHFAEKRGSSLPPLRRSRAKKTAASLLWREEPSF